MPREAGGEQAGVDTTPTPTLTTTPAAPRTGSLPRTITRWAGRVALALAIVGFWLEVAPRFLFGVQPLTKESIVWEYHPKLGWWHEPGASGTFVKLDCRQPIVINSHGLREREIGHDKPPGVFRILALGNSVTVGFEVPPEAVFTRVLEDELNRRGCRVQVINAACRGWGSDQSLIYLREEGLKYHPDLVVYCVGGIEWATNLELHRPYRTFGKGYFALGPGDALDLRNVPVPEYPADKEIHVDNSGRVVEQPCSSKQAWLLWFRDNVVVRSAACTLVLETLTANPMLGRLLVEGGGFTPAAVTTEGGDEVASFRSQLGFRLLTATYRAMRRDAEAAGARFALCSPSTIDSAPLWTDQEIYKDSGQTLWDLGRARRERSRGASLRLKHDAHFNAEGHRAIGEALAGELLERGLVPAPKRAGGGGGP
jgi:lysophospholipase L1-like esterase